jgi:hypothetical protein
MSAMMSAVPWGLGAADAGDVAIAVFTPPAELGFLNGFMLQAIDEEVEFAVGESGERTAERLVLGIAGDGGDRAGPEHDVAVGVERHDAVGAGADDRAQQFTGVDDRGIALSPALRQAAGVESAVGDGR